MSNGGREIGRDIEPNPIKKKSRINDFSQSVARISVAQVCESAGFQSFQQSALNTLSDVAVRYIRSIGQTVNFYANLAGRTECNVFDIIQGLEDLSSLQGFSGASDVNHCLVGSGTVREISQYVGTAEEIPFAYSIPRFPVIKERTLTRSFDQAGESPPDEHIPAWLPRFPGPETYASLPSENERETKIGVQNNELVADHRMVEWPFKNLHQQLARDESEALNAADSGEVGREEQSAEINPFLAAPLQFREKEVSSVIPPAKLSNEYVAPQNYATVSNHVLVLESPAPAVEAVYSRFSDSEGGENVILNKRPSIRLKFYARKKPVSPALKLRNQYFQQTAPFFGNDSEKDGNKRSAEQILREPMDDTQKLA